ncbi:velvet factor-domain-containing protein [Rhodotorula diobovata]|uniref:Velvet factor-domain-containing protein n=1 Tax=Rhodotorula diobovata TaxID=5288 RepID=A0A5C5FRK3_9BASI|nr:velvet factor-domain-containing protein [Rhodotorula diobovata]
MSRRPSARDRDPSPPPAQPRPPQPPRSGRVSSSTTAAAATAAAAVEIAPGPGPSETSTGRPIHPPLISSSLGPGSSAAALGIGLGRAPRQAQVRRSSRRASLDPYPSSSSSAAAAAADAQRGESPEQPRRASRALRVSEEVVREEEEREEERSRRRGPPRREEASASALEAAAIEGERSFELVVLQQPQIGAQAGLGRNTLGRLPIVPAPVVEVIVSGPSGERTDVELPYLFCSCSLRQEDGVSPVEIAALADSHSAGSAGGDDVAEEFSALIGQLVRTPRRIEDLEGTQKSVFVFEDVSVRTKGSYKLEFRLGEARRPKSPKLAAVVSDKFDVVDWQDYPGRPPSEVVTDLSIHLHEQGVPMYIPPLLLSQPGELAPPPPSSNPFPVNFSELDALAEVATSTSGAQAGPSRPTPRRPPSP